MEASDDGQWIAMAYQVLSSAQTAMHVSKIEELVRTNILDHKDSSLISKSPTMSLEVLLTKEAAMGRRFTKPDGSPPGFFSLLPPQHAVKEEMTPSSPLASSYNLSASSSDPTAAADLRYQHKYNQLKKTCKQMIYLNAALYDDIARIERKIEKCSKERKVILEKVMTDLNIVNHRKTKTKSQKASESESVGEPSTPASIKRKAKAAKEEASKKTSTSPKKRKVSNEEEEESSVTTVDEDSSRFEGAKKGTQGKCISIPPISLDPAGRPILPLVLSAGLTVYSIGEICEKAGYSVSTSIYPVGYCCTRTFAWIQNPSVKCLYTCKISEGLVGPKFEISADADQHMVFEDETPEGCHSQLLQKISAVTSKPISPTTDSDFFGLNHPVVKNLLQCSHGAASCVGYEWSKFEVVKKTSQLSKVPSELDPATNFRVFAKLLNLEPPEELDSSNDQSSESDVSSE
ncbi:transforming growth factor beta regulator 1-like [Watersipora subatra]|uniref:transforming growth factor beta regulator 1-like n=1 Tax=Watersipora subatra TaxID=2589382 RepID=UPI00355C7A82